MPSSSKKGGINVDSNVTWGVVMIALGYSGAFADSSFALYLVGGAMLLWGVFRTFFPAQQAVKKKTRPESADGLRETVESLVVAFILAFLFKSFEAEAFVIPTGSMAPTLLGRHKDVECEQCGYKYTVGASEELEDGRLVARLQTSACPNCRFQNDVKDLAPFPGDRIIVTKLLEDPVRFDVIVFKYPEEPHVNYIKRCVGMPNETIMIQHGDLFRRVSEGDEWEILRKADPDKQQQIQVLVYDDRYHPTGLEDAGWPARWAGVSRSDSARSVGGWLEDESSFTATDSEGISYSIAAGADVKWLRYRHFAPQEDDWQAAISGMPLEPAARLVTDFCGYNHYTSEALDPRFRRSQFRGPNSCFWVGDLTVECKAEVKQVGGNGELVLELVEGQMTYRARFSTGSGLVKVTRTWEGDETEIASTQCEFSGPGEYELRFANVDDRLAVWVNNRVLDLGEAMLQKPEHPTPSTGDLSPAGIAARDMDVAISDIVLYRDIYYRDDSFGDIKELGLVGSPQDPREEERRQILFQELHRPDEWAKKYSEYRRARDTDLQRAVTYALGPDEYLMFGDNSPRSLDARLFDETNRKERGDVYTRHAVPADAIIGKAFFVYWPHGVPFMNEGKGYPFKFSYHVDTGGNITKDYPNHRVPFYPNIPRMRRIR